MQTQPLGPFLGLNNRLPDYALRIATAQIKGDYLAQADNVDLDNANRVRRRAGFGLVQAMTGAHSVFKNYLVRASTIYSFTLAPYSETLVKVLESDAKMSWLEFNGSVYFSNGTDSGRIESGTVYPWAMPTPGTPVCTSIAGTIPAGLYQVAVSYFNNVTGEEGGLSASNNFEVTAPGTIRVTLPGAVTGATHVKVYISKINGEVPALYTTVTAATASVDITSTNTTQTGGMTYVEPLPAGTRIFMHMGRLCSVKDNILFYSDPYRIGYYQPHEGYIPFATTVSIATPCQMGVYVAADKTYWIPGDLKTPDHPISDVLPYGAVPGTEFEFPHESKVGWMSAKGFAVGDTQGEAQTPTIGQVDVTLPASGCSYFFESGGIRRVFSCGYVLNVENNAVTTYSNFDFTSMSSGLATKPTGLYSLGGTTDAGALIASTVCLGKQKFGADNLKRMPTVYAGMDFDALLQLRVVTPDGNDFTYDTVSSAEELSIQKFVVGRGFRANWFQLFLYNKDGADFSLATVSFDTAVSTRRVG